MDERQKALDRLVDIGAELAADQFAKRGEVNPVWLAETSGGELLIIPGLLDDKDDQMLALRLVFVAKGVVRYVMVQEAWMAEVKRDALDAFGGAVSQHPDRREVVFVQAEDDTTAAAARYFILRPEHGPPKLSPLERLGSTETFRGRMVGLLRGPR